MSSYEVQGFESDEELIGYCELHCKTERALFNGIQIKRMHKLAGKEIPPAADNAWSSMYGDMAELCKLARRHRGAPKRRRKENDMSEEKEVERSFAQVTVDKERKIMDASDELHKKLCLLDAKIFGEKPGQPSSEENEKQARCFQNDMMGLQAQTSNILVQLHAVVDKLNTEFDN